jgi:hypothetical protein
MSERTGLPDRTENVSGATNFSADLVKTTRTSSPRSRKRRTISAAL